MENYTRQSRLGEGGFGIVYLVRDRRDGQLYVMKEVDMAKLDAKAKADAVKEAQFLRHLRHPNIVGYHDYFESKTIQPTRFGHATVCKLHIVMDYADGGDLESRIKAQKGRPFPESQVIAWLVQMALALKHVHDRKILHRDIKAQNVFLTNQGMVKLGDFGIAKSLAHTFAQARTMIGTPYYLSPEICREAPYDSKSDMWALGVVLYEMMCLTHPFKGNSMQDLLKRICTAQPPPPPPVFSAPLRALCSRLLSKDPAQRPSIDQLLGQPFIRAHAASFLDQQLLNAEFSHTVLHTHTHTHTPERVAAHAALADKPDKPPTPAPVPPSHAARGVRAAGDARLRVDASAHACAPRVAPVARARALALCALGLPGGARATPTPPQAARGQDACVERREGEHGGGVSGMGTAVDVDAVIEVSGPPGPRHPPHRHHHQSVAEVAAAADVHARGAPARAPRHRHGHGLQRGGGARGGGGGRGGASAGGAGVPAARPAKAADGAAGQAAAEAEQRGEQDRLRLRALAREAWRAQLAEARRRGVARGGKHVGSVRSDAGVCDSQGLAARPPWVDVVDVEDARACAQRARSHTSHTSPPHTRGGDAGACPGAGAAVVGRADAAEGGAGAAAFDPFKGGQTPAGVRAQAQASYEQQLARARRAYQVECLNARRRQQGLPPVAISAVAAPHLDQPHQHAPVRAPSPSPCSPAPAPLRSVPAAVAAMSPTATTATSPRAVPTAMGAASGAGSGAGSREAYEAELARVRAAYAEERRRARARALTLATEADALARPTDAAHAMPCDAHAPPRAAHPSSARAHARAASHSHSPDLGRGAGGGADYGASGDGAAVHEDTGAYEQQLAAARRAYAEERRRLQARAQGYIREAEAAAATATATATATDSTTTLTTLVQAPPPDTANAATPPRTALPAATAAALAVEAEVVEAPLPTPRPGPGPGPVRPPWASIADSDALVPAAAVQVVGAPVNEASLRVFSGSVVSVWGEEHPSQGECARSRQARQAPAPALSRARPTPSAHMHMQAASDASPTAAGAVRAEHAAHASLDADYADYATMLTRGGAGAPYRVFYEREHE